MNDLTKRLAALTPEQREAFLVQMQKKKGQTQQQILPQSRETKVFPLSFSQQRLWLLDQLEPQSSMYNMPSVLRLQGRFAVEAFEKSLAHIMQRHEVLRTTFSMQDDQPVQVIASSLSLSAPLIDLSQCVAEEREHLIGQLMQQEVQLPFDLTTGPLLRTCLLRLDEQDHVLLFSMHHIVSDGWSIGILLRELTALYQAEINGESAQLPALAVQYADYALWQRQRLQGQFLQAQIDYWQQQLLGAPIALHLPTDHPRPPLLTYKGSRQTLSLSPKLQQALKEVGQRERTTLFMVLLAAYQVLLMRYSGQHDIVVGSPIANRTREEVAGLIGFFVNTLVLRTDLVGNPTFRQLLARVREVTLQAYAHQDLPFEKLVAELQSERDMSRQPIFQVAFMLQNLPPSHIDLTDTSWKLIENNHAPALFDLSLRASESASGLLVALEYNTALFEDTTIRRFLGHWQMLLEAIVQDIDQPIGYLPLLTKAELEQQLIHWNVSDTLDQDEALCLHQLFEEQVARTPDAVALVFEEQCLTYDELNRRANQLAHHLRRLGVVPDVLVALCLERSLEMLIGLLAVLKAGGAYVPIDPSYPAERIARLLEECQPCVVLSQQHLLDLHTATSSPILLLDAFWQTFHDESTSNLSSQVTPENLVYLIYTSGSTGVPKGAGVYQKGFLNLLTWFLSEFDLSAHDQGLVVTSFSFDLTQKNLFAPLLVGGCVNIQPSGYDIDLICQSIVQRQITRLNCTPSMFYPLLEATEASAFAPLQSLRTVFLGGEAIALNRLWPWMHAPQFHGEIVNTYGPTECSDVVAYHRLIKTALTVDAIIPLGRPIANTQLLILDAQMQLVPPLVVGEIYIAGRCVGAGYLYDTALTAAKFVPNPFAEISDERLYKTGDRARYQADGAIEFLGRVDQQVKLRGFRIELGEIEATLVAHPAVQEAVVLAREDQSGDTRLVAYLVLDLLQAEVTDPAVPAPLTTEHLVLAQLRQYLRERLPDYMVPANLMVLKALPLTANGKLDRRALPAVEQNLQHDQAVIEPRTPLEEVIRQIWADLLQLSPSHLSIHDDFFALGGHSLLATRMISRLQRRVQVDVPVLRLFEAPTIATLAQHVEMLLRGGIQLSIPALLPVGREQAVPLSFAQERLWVLQQLEPQSTAYHIPVALRLQGPLSILALEESLRMLVERHESLRTTFISDQGQPIQVIAPALPMMVPVIDLQTLTQSEREEQMHDLLQQAIRQPFDLASGPLLRVFLLRLEEQDQVLLVNMHHIATDAWSMGVLVRDLSAFYQSQVQGLSSELSALPIQYADYSLWQRQWLQGEVLARQLTYWKQQLIGAPTLLALPIDPPHAPAHSFTGARQEQLLSLELLQQLQQLSRQEDVTLFMTLLAAFQVLLMRYSGQTDIVVGSPIANRTHEELEHLIGFFVNTLVLRIDLAGNPSFLEVLRSVREVCLGAYAHQDLPFEHILDEIKPIRGLSGSSLFQVMFTLQNVPQEQGDLAGVRVSQLDVESVDSKCDLILFTTETAQGLHAVFEYNTALFEAETIRRLLSHWRTLLEGMVSNVQTHIDDLPLLAQDEQDQILISWNATQRDYPQHLCLHQLFEAQVAQTPDAVAVVFEDEQVTYAVLNRRATSLAVHLREAGVGVDIPVGVCLERSCDLLIAFLAILKAGGAYLPLDPAYPQERLSFMLADTTTRLIISHSQLRTHLPEESAHIICLDQFPEPLAFSAATTLQNGQFPEQMAYIMYTSGSTGQPKGIAIPHLAVVRLLFNTNYVTLGRQDCVAWAANAAFDAATFEIWGALLHGGRLVIVPHEDVLDPQPFAQLLRRQAITTLFLTTALFNQLARTVPQAFAHLKQLLFGGEAVDVQAVEIVLKHGAPERLLHVYGPTESTTYATWYHIQHVATHATTIPIGAPLSNTTCYILDASLRPVPIGVSGELYLGGDGLARGYLHRPEMTAERFLPHPFSDEPGLRLYRTGDLARYLSDGTIEYLGRLDQQVKIRGFRVELGEIEATLGSYPAVQDAVVLAREDVPGTKRLVAYLVMQQGQTFTSNDLRLYVQARLPLYMVPTLFVPLDVLPLTSNGKVDRRKLPMPDWEHAQTDDLFLAPRTELEKALVTIWEEVLHTSQVGIRDNFFERGGDSILGIQLITRARQQGLRLTLKQLFRYQTIEQLNTVVESENLVQTAHLPIVGRAPLIPIQHWFFELDLAQASHWNQSLLLETAVRLNPSLLEEATGAWLNEHDVFRLRFTYQADGWQQAFSEQGNVIPFSLIDLSYLPETQQEMEIPQLAEQTQASLDIVHGPLVRVVMFERGLSLPQLLLLVIHHLVVDGVSWRILLEDLQIAYQQRVEGQEIQLSTQTSSFQAWGQHLVAYAQSNLMQDEIPYWLNMRTIDMVRPLPLDFPVSRQENTVAASELLTATLTVEETRALLEDLPSVYHTQINEVLLTALAQTLAQWTGSSSVLLDLEGHGREDLFEEVDLSRTVGWFTSMFPVLLQIGEASNIAAAMMAVKEQLRTIPQHGIGYGLLRYLSTDTTLRARLAAMPQADLSFNYLGQLDQQRLSSLFVGAAPLSAGSMQSSSSKRAHLLEIVCQISAHRLRVSFRYCKLAHRSVTIERLINSFLAALRAIIHHGSLPEAGGYSPSDFPNVPLQQNHLEQILLDMAPGTKTIEAIDFLSPLQQGMLSESVQASASGIHIEQSLWTLTGELDVAAFERAWQWGVQRHDILRSAFVWKTLTDPLQVILPHISLSLEYQDLSSLSPEEQRLRVEEIFHQQRMDGFQLTHPPLMRLTLFHLEPQSYSFLWTYHHLIMDGWSRQILLGEIVACYAALRQGDTFVMQPAHPYREYLSWLHRQERSQARHFWSTTLRGFTQPTLLGRVHIPGETISQGQSRSQSMHLLLSTSISTTLQREAQRHRLTFSTLLQGAWALLLHRYSGSEDVVFGITVSGRPAELAGIETMVGPCINTLPLRVQIPPSGLLWPWLEDLQAHTLEMHAYEYSPAGQIHQWSEVPGKLLLYESLLVVENYPSSMADALSGDVGLTIRETNSKGAQTKYALTFLVTKEAILCVYDAARFAHSTIEQILEHFEAILTAIVSNTETSLATLCALIPVEQIPLVVAPEPIAQQPQEAGEQQALYSPFEQVVAGVWCEVLGLDQIGRESNFFAVGGHSLVATQVIGRLRVLLTIEIPLSAMFDAPTVAGMARWIEQAQRTGEGIVLPPLVARERPHELPLSFSQQRLWFLDQLDPKSTTYLVPTALRIEGVLGAQHFEQSLNALIVRHESLRTTFTARDGQPVQIIHAIKNYTLPVIDLQGLSQERRELEARHLAEQEAQHPCDLEQGPLLRFFVIRLELQVQIVLLTLHHIITDGWSSNVLIRELTTLYHAFSTGQASPLAPLPIQYADYALWQREWLQGEVLEQQLIYWKEQLANAPAFLDLPIDHPRPSRQTFSGAYYTRLLSPELLQQLQSLSQQEGVTLFMTLLAAFQVLLMRYSGQTDIVVGTPIANRTYAETEDVIGMFVNTLVLRCDVSGRHSFHDLLAHVRAVTLQAYAHQDLPFEQLVDALHAERSLSYTPLFQVFLALQNMPKATMQVAGQTWTPLAIEQTTTRFDLSLFLQEGAQGLHVGIEYNTTLFEPATISRLLDHWQVLLSTIVVQPEQSIDRLPLLTQEEYQQLLQVNQSYRADLPPLLGLHEYFEQQVERTPEAIAVVFAAQHLTYQALDQRANQLAHWLRDQGVGPDLLVGVFMERSMEMLIALLGIFKAGGAYLPLDPGYPQERIDWIVQQADPALILTQAHLVNLGSANSHRLFCLDSQWAIWTQESTERPEKLSLPEHLAYVMYTSGSTGKPKGVAVEQRSTVALVSWALQTFSPQELAGVIASTSISFDISVFEIFVPLSGGGSVILVENVLHIMDMPEVARATLLNTVPSAATELVATQNFPTSLCTINLAGEPLAANLVQQFYEQTAVQRVYNLYGPTEDTIYSTYALMEREEIKPGIGRPIVNTQALILDTSLNLVPVGIAGELYLGGAGQARGYLKRGDLTAERFVPHPWSQEPGARLYRTGDQARYRADGTIEYLGRLDQQVKLRGFRIEMGEIEAVLRVHSGVHEAVVALREDTRGEKFLVAYVVARLEEPLKREEIRGWLHQHLPDYMVPGSVIFLETLPLTPNGKLDRLALPAPSADQIPLEALVLPRNMVESALASIWRELLDVDYISIVDNFFQAGGHSLLSVQLLNRIQRQFGVSLSLATLFQAPTIEQQARLVFQQDPAALFPVSPLVRIQPAGVKQPFFCVHPALGYVYSFVSLAGQLRRDRPFCGIQSCGLDGEQEPFTTIEEMAVAYIDAVRAVQPEGPYFLGGYSFGGLVAFEMARQIQAQGDCVALLAIIDTSPVLQADPAAREQDVKWEETLSASAQQILQMVEFLREEGKEVAVSYDDLQYLQPDEQLAYFLQRLREVEVVPQEMDLTLFRRLLRVHRANMEAHYHYRPQLYTGQVTLFSSAETAYDHASNWSAYTSAPVEAYIVPGQHQTILTMPSVTSLATQLQACLDKADESVDFNPSPRFIGEEN